MLTLSLGGPSAFNRTFGPSPSSWKKAPVKFPHLLGRPQSADKKFVRARGPQIGTQKCSTKRGLRKPLHVEFALYNRESVKAEAFEKRVFEQTAPLKL